MGQDANNRARDSALPTSRRELRCERNLIASRPRAGAGCRYRPRPIRSRTILLLWARRAHPGSRRPFRAGAGFVVVLMGNIRTMPGCPHSLRRIACHGEIDGLSWPNMTLNAASASSRKSSLLSAPMTQPAAVLIIAAFRLTSARALRAGDPANDRRVTKRKAKRGFR